MFDLLSIVQGRRKKTSRGWTSFNAMCCHHRGHRPDKRMRGGIKKEDNVQVYHCFNCQYSCKFELGKAVPPKTKQLLRWCGLDDLQINAISLNSIKNRDLMDFSSANKPEFKKVSFNEFKLPDGELIDQDNPNHGPFVKYLVDRRIDPSKYPFMVTPNESGRMGNRIIIPFTFEGKIIGCTSRFLDDKKPKYLNEHPPGYLFGYDLQKPEWSVCIVTEGIFDAISIDGCALGTSTINTEQRALLYKLRRNIIVVPDQDTTGLELCNQALDLGFKVSLPNWGYFSNTKRIKDVNDAVIKYGKLPTILSILQSATTSKVKIRMMLKKIKKRIQLEETKNKKPNT